MERMKHTGDYELDEINMLEQECVDLEEENKRLEKENKNLKEINEIQNEEIQRFKDNAMADADYELKLEVENKKLKEKIRRLEFDVDAWYQLKLLLEWEIEKLREELSAYDREYFDEDKKAENIYKSQKENILMWKIC